MKPSRNSRWFGLLLEVWDSNRTQECTANVTKHDAAATRDKP